MSWWLFAAYAIVVLVLAGYASWLELGARRTIERELELRVRLGSVAGFSGLGGRLDVLLGLLASSGFALAAFMAFIYAPREKTMGTVQRIFYFHVPAAWAGFLAFFVCMVASIVCLAHLTRRPRAAMAADRLAAASAEVGVVFTSLVLITGPIWAKPVWFVWWAWDARLTSTLILWLIYVAYLMLRSQLDDDERRARLAAVVAILGFIDVPIVYFAIRWWRTQHPQPVIGGGQGSGLDPLMLRAFYTALAAYTLVYLTLVVRRAAIARRRADNEELERQAVELAG